MGMAHPVGAATVHCTRYVYPTISMPLCPQDTSAGWGGRDRTSEWRNQNPFDYAMISRRIWKKSEKWAGSNFNSLAAVSK